MNEGKYDHEWFKRRAVASIKKINEGVWDYSDSLLLYVSSGVETYESLQEIDTPYFKLVTQPEREYLQSIAKDVVQELPSYFEYVNLGPGTEHKEQFIFDEAKKQNKQFTYIPVDISDHYLKLAESHAVGQDIVVKKIQASFEELSGLLGEAKVPRFVSIGLTFSNYVASDAISLLEGIAGKGGFIFINTHIRDRVDMAALQNAYQKDAVTVADEKLRLIGIDPDHDITPRLADDKIQVSGFVLNTNKTLEDIGIKNGDKMILFQSLRYTKNQLEEVLKDTRHTLFDTGNSFIGSVIKND